MIMHEYRWVLVAEVDAPTRAKRAEALQLGNCNTDVLKVRTCTCISFFVSFLSCAHWGIFE